MKFRIYTLMALTGVLLLSQACSRPLDPEPGCTFVQNADLQRVAWRKGRIVELYLHVSFPREAYPVVDRVVEKINRQFGQIFKVVGRGQGGPRTPVKDGYSTIYWMDTWESGKRTEQARTTIYWSGTEIFETDMRINGADFDFAFGPQVEPGKVDLESLILHEFGHMLGLAHNAESGSVMNVSLDQGQDRRDLTPQDESNLKCEY